MKQKKDFLRYIFLCYWIIQAIILLTVKGFGMFPIILGVIILTLGVSGLFIRNKQLETIISIIFFCSSFVICFGVAIAALFFAKGQMPIYLFLGLITLLNIFISTWMLRNSNKEINADNTTVK